MLEYAIKWSLLFYSVVTVPLARWFLNCQTMTLTWPLILLLFSRWTGFSLDEMESLEEEFWATRMLWFTLLFNWLLQMANFDLLLLSCIMYLEVMRWLLYCQMLFLFMHAPLCSFFMAYKLEIKDCSIPDRPWSSMCNMIQLHTGEYL